MVGLEIASCFSELLVVDVVVDSSKRDRFRWLVCRILRNISFQIWGTADFILPELLFILANDMVGQENEQSRELADMHHLRKFCWQQKEFLVRMVLFMLFRTSWGFRSCSHSPLTTMRCFAHEAAGKVLAERSPSATRRLRMVITRNVTFRSYLTAYSVRANTSGDIFEWVINSFGLIEKMAMTTDGKSRAAKRNIAQKHELELELECKPR